MADKVANKREPVPDYKRWGRNPVPLGTFKSSSSQREVNVISASALSMIPSCFQDNLLVNEDESYKMLKEVCKRTEPYSLHDILRQHQITIDSKWEKGKKSDIIAAIGIATYLRESDSNVLLNIITEPKPIKKSTQSSATTSSSTQSRETFKGAVLNSRLAVVCDHQVFPFNNLTTWLANSDMHPDVSIYPYPYSTGLSNAESLIALDEMQRNLIPYVEIECRSSKMLLCTARQCAIKCIELLRLERAYGSTSSEFIGFVLPDLLEASETDKMTVSLSTMTLAEDTSVLSDPPVTSEMEETTLPEEQTSSNVSTTGKEKSVAEGLAKKKEVPLKKQNLAIKVTVRWNSEHLAFDVTYDVLKCSEVMSSIKSVIQNQQKNRELSNGQFSHFFKLTDQELEVVKGSIRSSLECEGSFHHVFQNCDFNEPLEQFHSCFSFVFGLKGQNTPGYIFKTFPRNSLKDALEDNETKIHRRKGSLPLLSQLSLRNKLLHEVIGFKDHNYFVFERLHQISLDAAKQCLVQLLEGVRGAIENLHSFNFAHLDVRLPNVCLKVDPENKKEDKDKKATVMLIDLERSQSVTLSNTWCDVSYISCMYKVGLSYQQVDYMQLYWMGFWILLSEEHKSLVDYHDMNNTKYLSDKELNDEHLVNIRDFINKLPPQHDEKQWKNFMKLVKATKHEDSCTLLDTVIDAL